MASLNARTRVLLPLSVLAFLGGCNEPCPHYAPTCAEITKAGTGPLASFDARPRRIATVPEDIPGVAWVASASKIAEFLGTDSFKLAIAVGKRLYLALPAGGSPQGLLSVRMDRGDEGPNGNSGWPNEPLFSPDGRWLAYAGDFPKSRTNSFVREAVVGSSWSVPVIRSAGTAAHPHWFGDSRGLWLFLSDVATTTTWNPSSRTNNGATWKTRFLDSAIGEFEPATLSGNAIPGAFKGGISRDGRWAGTSYQQSVLWDANSLQSFELNGGIQQCNPSMNPFAGGSNTDYMMILGFGGPTPVPTLDGPAREGQHEHLWIWSKEDRAVWGAALPNVAPHPADEVPGVSYYEWQRPEWSTHPDYATAFAKRTGSGDGVGYDLFLVKLGPVGGELAAHDRSTMLERGPVLRVATGDFLSSDWSHLWVKP